MTFTVEIQNYEEIKELNHIVHIFVSPDEIDQLLTDLQRLKTAEPGTSVRLFSSHWGGGELSEIQQRNDSVLTNMLRIWRAE